MKVIERAELRVRRLLLESEVTGCYAQSSTNNHSLVDTDSLTMYTSTWQCMALWIVSTFSAPPSPAPSPHLLELSLTDPISIEDDLGGLEARGLVELDQHLTHHAAQLHNDLLVRQ